MLTKRKPPIEQNSETIRVRWLIRRDLPDIQWIENRSFDKPIDPDTMLRLVRSQNTTGFVAEVEKTVVGYAILMNDGELSIVRLAVDPVFRRMGVGGRIVRRIKERMTYKMPVVRTCLCDRNLGGHLFLKSQGFIAGSVVRRPDGMSDMYEFSFREEWEDE